MLITFARKPLVGSVVQNVLTHGCGALNIDASRIATSDDFNGVQGFASMKLNAQRKGESDEEWKARAKDSPEQQAALAKLKTLGRWPANVLLTGAEGVLAGFPHTASGTRNGIRKNHEEFGTFAERQRNSGYFKEGDSGSAARFFKKVGEC